MMGHTQKTYVSWQDWSVKSAAGYNSDDGGSRGQFRYGRGDERGSRYEIGIGGSKCDEKEGTATDV